MSDTTSVLELFDRLCDIHLGAPKRVYRVQPVVSRAAAKKRLKKVLFNGLLQHVLGVEREQHSSPGIVGSETEGILLQIYRLREKKLTHEANRLEFLFNKLMKDDNDDVKCCLRLLVALKDCGTSPIDSSKDQCGTLCIPSLKKDEEQMTQQGPISYRMGMLALTKGTHYYFHYPRELFESLPPADFGEYERTESWVMNSTPGWCINEDSLLAKEGQSSFLSVFGNSSPNFQATPNFRIPEFKGRQSKSFTQLSDVDSGQSSMSGSVLDQTPPLDLSIWYDALTATRSKHYTWERIGLPPGPTERPYLTEAGRQMFDAVIRLRLHNLSVVDVECSTSLITVDSCLLTKHILLMLVGVPSWIFPYNKEAHSFHITPGIHISGISPEMLASAVTPFIQFGTFFNRLAHFARSPDTDNSFYSCGLVFKAFTAAIRKVLNHYNAAILQIPSTLTMLQLRTHLHSAMQQIEYLARLCEVHDGPPQDPQSSGFPMGMKLLKYLYTEAQVSSCCGHYPVLLSILTTSWTPFMLFVNDWMFHGVHNDKYKEFLIDEDVKRQENRDEDYWDGAYTFAQGLGTTDDLPDFLQPVVKDIVTCGKAINLIRLCNPQHFLCRVPDGITPSIGISFSLTDLTSMEQYCQIYVQRQRQIGMSISEDRLAARKREKREKQELKETARKVADEEIARLQGIIDERKRKMDVKKRKEFKRLKEQMESDLERRAGEEQLTKEEDRQFMARLAREEDALTQEEIELEARARDELIEYYTGLTEEAMHRERKALWKVRRGRLDTARAQFLMDDAQKWVLEMKELGEGKEVFDSVDSGNIPRWADRSSRELPILVEEEDNIVSLPQWARQESVPTSFSPTDVTIEGLPDWAVRGMNGQLVEVDESDEEETEDNESDKESSKYVRQFRAVQLGGPAHQKPQIKSFDELNAMKETDEFDTPVHTRGIEGKHVSIQSDQSDEKTKSCIKKVEGGNILKQTEEKAEKIHIKKSESMQATTTTEAVDEKPSIKMSSDKAVNDETTDERHIIPKRGTHSSGGNITQQTESQVWAFRKPSLFGHVSQLSKADPDFGIPSLRRNTFQHVNVQSDFKDYGMKPHIRMNQKMSATTESIDRDISIRPRIRFNRKQYANMESDQIDHHQLAVARFKQRNVKGHASDSTVQRLLYGIDEFRFGSQSEDENKGPPPPLPKVVLTAGNPYEAQPYTTYFNLRDKPSIDLMSSMNIADLGRNYLNSSSLSEEEVGAYEYIPLSSLLSRAVATPVRAQVSLVDNAIINYFTSELKVEEHFAAVRRYIFMADGDFAQILCDILTEKLATKPRPHEILNPMFLKRALTKAIRSSMHSEDPYAQRLSFRLVYMPKVLMPNEPQSLRCLDLRYIVDWPLNIVFTESCMEKYSQVFSFLLQIKRVVWNLKDVWHRLKRDALISKAGRSPHFVQLQLHRQEMEHFMKMMQGYVTNQVIHVTWQELQADLAGDIAGLDQLKAIHESYLQKALSRCLLEKKAKQVMHIILKIFCLILKFRTQLFSSNWQQDEQGQVVHPNFSQMKETYQSFHAHSIFLFKVVNILAQRGYQPHLQELLIQLNFNDYYTQAAK